MHLYCCSLCRCSRDPFRRHRPQIQSLTFQDHFRNLLWQWRLKFWISRRQWRWKGSLLLGQLICYLLKIDVKWFVGNSFKNIIYSINTKVKYWLHIIWGQKIILQYFSFLSVSFIQFLHNRLLFLCPEDLLYRWAFFHVSSPNDILNTSSINLVYTLSRIKRRAYQSPNHALLQK